MKKKVRASLRLLLNFGLALNEINMYLMINLYDIRNISKNLENES